MKKFFIMIMGILLLTGCNEKKESNSDGNTTSRNTTKAASTVNVNEAISDEDSSNNENEHITTNEVENTTTTTTVKNDKTTAKTSGVMTSQVNTSKVKESTTKKTTTSTTTTSKKTTTTTSKKTTTTTKNSLTEKEVYNKIIALKSKYPNGTPWSNDKCYNWKGGYITTGCGCAGFAFTLSDAAFGSRKATKHTDISKIRVGDVLRVNGNTHSVIVLSVDSSGVTVAEGNMTIVGVFENGVYWGRKISSSELKTSVDYILTRW